MRLRRKSEDILLTCALSTVLLPQENVQLAVSVLGLTVLALELVCIILMPEEYGGASLYDSLLKQNPLRFQTQHWNLLKQATSVTCNATVCLTIRGFTMYGI